MKLLAAAALLCLLGLATTATVYTGFEFDDEDVPHPTARTQSAAVIATKIGYIDSETWASCRRSWATRWRRSSRARRCGGAWSP